MERRVSVCHLTTRLVRGGADFNIYYNLLHGAPRFDLCLVVGPEYDEEMVSNLRDAGVEVVSVPTIRRSINPFNELMAFFVLRRLFRTRAFDIVYTHNAKTGILGRFAVPSASSRAAKFSRLSQASRPARPAEPSRPIVIHGIHGMSFTDTMPRPVFLLFRWLERRAAHRTDWFVSVGEKIRDLMLEAGVGRQEQYRIIRSGMEIERFTGAARDSGRRRLELRRTLGCTDGGDDTGGGSCVLFAVVARLERRKGQHWFLEAFAAACAALDGVPEAPVGVLADGPRGASPGASSDTLPDLRAVLLGDGGEREALEEQARQLGIDHRITFAGFRDNPEDYLVAADVVCLTSEWEGVPQSLVQAAAAGRPSLAFDVAGIREILEPERTGEVVPHGDVQALANAMVRLARDPVLRKRYGSAAAERDLAEWRLETMVERTEDLYRELVEARRS